MRDGSDLLSKILRGVGRQVDYLTFETDSGGLSTCCSHFQVEKGTLNRESMMLLS